MLDCAFGGFEAGIEEGGDLVALLAVRGEEVGEMGCAVIRSVGGRGREDGEDVKIILNLPRPCRLCRGT